MATATIDLSAGLVPNAAPGGVDISAGLIPKPINAPANQGTERAMQMTMGGTPMFVDVPRGTGAQFEQAGREGYQKGGVIGAGLVAGAGAAAAAGPSLLPVAGALAPIAKKYGIKALEGAGLGLGYDLYKDLKGVFEGK